MEAIMQSPLTALMGIAKGAVDLMHRATGHDSPKTGFDEQLHCALAEAPGADKPITDKLIAGKPITDTPIADKPIKEKVKAERGPTDDDRKGLLENPQATQVQQYLCALQSMGLNSADAKALLSGSAEVSDEGLKAILAAIGIKGADIAQLMADPNLVAGLKSQLAQTVSTKVHAGINALLQGKGAEISDEDLKAILASIGTKDADIKKLMEDQTRLADLKAQFADAVFTKNNSEAKSFLQGAGAEISDEDLKAILAAMGIKDADIPQFMADPEVVSDLKAKLAQIRSLQLGEQTGGNAPDMDRMIEQAAAGQDTAHAIAARIGTHKGIPQGSTKEITQALAEIKESVAEFLKTAETQPVNKETPLFTQMLKAQSEQSS